jgi:hypothetical protein
MRWNYPKVQVVLSRWVPTYTPGVGSLPLYPGCCATGPRILALGLDRTTRRHGIWVWQACEAPGLGWAGVRVAAADAFVAAARLAGRWRGVFFLWGVRAAPPPPPRRRWSLPFFLRFGDRFAFPHGDPEQKRRSHLMSFHKSLPLSFSSAHSFCP